MKLMALVKNIGAKITSIFNGRFSQTRVLTGSVLMIVLLLVVMLSWDAFLFMRSIAPAKGDGNIESKTVTLTPQDIDGAIRILNERQAQFNALLQKISGTTTVSF